MSSHATSQIVEFLRKIGLPVVHGELGEKSFLPGVSVDRGRLVVDEQQLCYPGDLLHEAGHLAVIPAAARAERAADLGTDAAEEIGAIAWSYAAVVHLKLDPAIVFHAAGYRGGSESLLQNFHEGRYIGVPLLQWLGLTLDEKAAKEQGRPAYPHMLRWLCE